MCDYTVKIKSEKRRKIVVKSMDNKLKLKNYFGNKTYNVIIIIQ